MQKNKIKLQIVLISYHKFVSSRIKMMQHNAGQCQPTLCVCTHIHVTICKYHRKDQNFLSTDRATKEENRNPTITY